MKKIPSLFKRDYDNTRLAYDEVTEGCEWVMNGEGIPTIKWDGTSCAIIDGEIYKRYDAKHGKTPPEGAIPCEPERNEHTGHWPHWVKCDIDSKSDKYHFEGLNNYKEANKGQIEDGTYELIGPKVNGNKHLFGIHQLLKHGDMHLDLKELSFEYIKRWCGNREIEGIVWHHPDGRMCKVKRKDFGFKW